MINLLEALLYHRDACEAASERMLDLVDYCHRAIQYLVSRCPSRPVTTDELP